MDACMPTRATVGPCKYTNAAGGLEGFYGQMQLVAWRGFMGKCSWWPGGVLCGTLLVGYTGGVLCRTLLVGYTGGVV